MARVEDLNDRMGSLGMERMRRIKSWYWVRRTKRSQVSLSCA